MPAKKTSSAVVLVNPETTPIVYSQDGHTLGGGERREVDALDAVGQRAVDAGLLISTSVTEDPGPVLDVEKPRTGASDPGSKP
jgi:hypothetical protein